MTRANGNGGRDDDASAGGISLEDQPVSIADIGWIDAPAILVFWILAIVVFLQFFTRYVLNDSLAWTEEVARYLLILVTFLGAVSVVRRGSNIMLEFVQRAVPPLTGKVLAVLAELITFGFFGTLTWIGVALTQKTRQKMISLPVPKAWIYSVCVAALAVMTVYSGLWLWRKIRQSPDEIRADLEHHLTGD